MAGLDPAIPLSEAPRCHIIGIAGSSPAMTAGGANNRCSPRRQRNPGERNDRQERLPQGRQRGYRLLQLRAPRRGARATTRGPSPRPGRRQARQDNRRPLPLPDSRGARSDGRGKPRDHRAGQRRTEPAHRHRRPARADGRHGDRHGSAFDQSVLVPQGPRCGRADRQAAEREARRALRGAPRPLRGVRVARAPVSRPRGDAARRRP